MKKIWFLFYNILIVPVLYIAILVLGLFNQKIKKGIRGRRRLLENLIITASSLDKTKKLLWFHSASMGEFEQAKPIIEKIKSVSDVNILVTFFSPSGYENSKKYPYADLVSYVPIDTKSNAERFIQIMHPDIAIMMRYDIWPNLIWQLKKFDIPTFIVDATLRDDSPRKKILSKSFHRNLYTDITRILTVSENDLQNFKQFGVTDSQLKVVGDTRFDRVYQRSLLAKERNLIHENLFKKKDGTKKKILVAGSTWEADEEVLIPAFLKLTKYDDDVILIIAPHEPTLIHLEKIENEFAGKLKTIRFSFLNHYKDEKVIIIDSIGILLTLYYYADVAYIGGSFKQGIHNVLEAAVYGIPVMFGPKIENSQEAKTLQQNGGGILVRNKKEAYKYLRLLFSNEDMRNKKGKVSFNYVENNIGATEKIIEEINRFI